MNAKQDKISLKAYYEILKRLHLELRDEICTALAISEKTFYNKLNNDSFTPAELHLISEILPVHINKLKIRTPKVA